MKKELSELTNMISQLRWRLFTVTIFTVGLIGMTASVESVQEKPTPGFNNKIPESIMTPDTVKTKVGDLNFFDGIPTKDTAALLFDNLDLNRGVDTFLNGMPAANVEAARRGHVDLGQKNSNQIVIFDELMDSNSLFLTGNTDTVYITTFLDLKRDGPIVIEIPAGAGPGIIIDAYSRYITNLGPPGPDQGKGGKYLLLPPGYDEKKIDGFVAQGFFIAKSPSWVDWVLLRGFLKDGKPNFSSQLFRKRDEDLSSQSGSKSAGDGVHRWIREGVQHRSLQRLQFFRGAACGDRSGTCRISRSASSRDLRVHWN